MEPKPIIYQMLPRLFSNANRACVPGGTIMQNGCGKLNDITPKALRAIRGLGATHVWYTGVIEHAHCSDYTRYGIRRDNPHIVKGQAGSPYAIKDYYDIDPDLAVDVPARMAEFEALVERTHAEGMKVIIDFVPNHVARQYESDVKPEGVKDLGDGDDHTLFFGRDNNFYYIPRQQFAPSVNLGEGADEYVEFPAKASGNDCFTAFPGEYDWYETAKLNYGVDYGDWSRHFDPIPDTWHKMLDILKFWASKGIDGFRCDMAHMVPVEFWRWAIAQVKEASAGVVFIAEIYEVGLYRPYIDAGFDYLYDKVNLYDTLRAVETGHVSAAAITSCWQTVGDIMPHMLNFLENHDEQRFASAQYAGDPQRVWPSLAVSSMMGTGPMMIYAGQELGEPAADAEGYSGADGRTTIFDYWSVDTLRRWLNGGDPGNDLLSPQEAMLRRRYAQMLNLCNSEAAIAEGKFFDLMYANYENPGVNPHRQFAFMRGVEGNVVLAVCNFDRHPADVKVNVPRHAFEFFGINEGKAKAYDLITGTEREIDFAPEIPVELQIGPSDAAIVRISPAKSAKACDTMPSATAIKAENKDN
ncbi:MAG: alpha-amylase family protein [Muribaculaceae bacterium]|nr:alpha-amylase family protein [Muribaculaceae bacterium]